MAATAALLRPLHQHLTQTLASQQESTLHFPLFLKIKQLSSSGTTRQCLCTRQVPMFGASEASSVAGVFKTTEEIKAELYLALQGTNRGAFGLTSTKKLKIEALVEQLEWRNPTLNPTDHLLYKERAINVINFSAKGLKLLTGQLTIEASYKITSKTRVNIKLENSSIMPDQLMNLFQKNYDLLIEIFNPTGWLDITYLDDSLRIGRDGKGTIFVLERAAQELS